MKITFNHTEEIAKNITSFWFKPPQGFSFAAGQFVLMHIPHPNADDRHEKRWFSLSSSPSESLIAITTKFAEPSSTFKQALRRLQPGDEVEIIGPLGSFILPEDPTKPIVLVAGGIGVTPYRSMIKWLIDTKQQRPIELIYAVNTAEELAFTDIFKAYNLEFIPIVREADTAWTGEKGLLETERILQLTGEPTHKHFYFSGPRPMVELLVNGLRLKNLPEVTIVTDYFPGYKDI